MAAKKFNAAAGLFDEETIRAAENRRMGVEEIELKNLVCFKNHPYKVIDDDKLFELVESIQSQGVIMPGIARELEDGKYEIIAGHRRKRACEIARKTTMPFIIKELTDDEAIMLMVDTNLQREEVLPSEKAFAYRMKLEAMRRQGKRTDLTSCQLGTKLRADSELAGETGESPRTIQRFVRLTYLIPEFLSMVDDKKLPINTGVEISYIDSDSQQLLAQVMTEIKVLPSMVQATQLKKISKERILTIEDIYSILGQQVIKPTKIVINSDDFFPSGYSEKERQSVVVTLLTKWREENRELFD